MYDNHKIDSIKQWISSGSINIFGLPFAGKDTQCSILQQIIGGHIIGGGEILRNSNITKASDDALHTGRLVPSADYKNMILPYLSKMEFNNHPLILSSVGRWHGEEDDIISNLEKSNHKLKAVIYLKTSNEDSMTRWLHRNIKNDRSNRYDDTKELLQIRLDEFKEKTTPVIDYYKNIGILIEVDGSYSQERVTSEIIDALFKKSQLS